MSKTPETSKKQLTPEEEVKKYLAEKLARAKEMGFDTENVYYHGTYSKDFNEFKSGVANSGRGIFFTQDPHKATAYATNDQVIAPQNARIIPTFIRGNLFDPENKEHLNKLNTLLKDKSDFPEQFRPLSSKELKTAYNSDKLINALEQLGFTGRIFGKGKTSSGYTDPNTLDWVPTTGQDEVIVFNPKNIRSKFAKFDPAMSESSDISSLTSSPSSLKNKLLNKAFKAADVIGMGSDVYKGNVADALVSAAEMSAPKLGTAASRFAPLLELLRPTEMETEDNITSDVPGAHSRKFKKLKSLFEKK